MTDEPDTEVYYLRWDEGLEEATNLYVRIHDEPPTRLSGRTFASLYRHVATVAATDPKRIERAFTTGGDAPAAFTTAAPRDLTIGDIVRTPGGYRVATLTGWQPVTVGREDPVGSPVERS